MFRNSDIIILSSSRWDDDYSSSALSLAKEFSKNNRVFYIDHPFSIKDFFTKYYKGNAVKSRSKALLLGKNVTRKLDGLSSNFNAITPRLTIPINWLPKGYLYEKLSKFNDRILYRMLQSLINEFGIQGYVYLNIFDPYFMRDIPTKIKPSISVYYTVDNISQERYIAKHGVYLEQQAVSKADIVLATSQELTRIVSKFSNKVHYLPNAADTSLFTRAVNETFAVPKEIRGLSKKIICYTGNIGLRIDYKLLVKVAETHHDKLLLMIGPLGNDDYKKAGLDKLSNVIFTGPKNINELPAYLQHVHCTIIPFEYTVLTKSIYPLKMNEYLAAGKPVVSTAFSEDISGFKDVAYIAHNDNEFIDMINCALNEDSADKVKERIQKAGYNTWENRVNQFWEILNSPKIV